MESGLYCYLGGFGGFKMLSFLLGAHGRSVLAGLARCSCLRLGGVAGRALMPSDNAQGGFLSTSLKSVCPSAERGLQEDDTPRGVPPPVGTEGSPAAVSRCPVLPPVLPRQPQGVPWYPRGAASPRSEALKPDLGSCLVFLGFNPSPHNAGLPPGQDLGSFSH